MKKLAWIILFLVFLMLYSHAVKHVLEGGQRLGVFTKPIKEFALFFTTAKDAYSQIKKDHTDDIEEGNLAYTKLNVLSKDLYVLNPSFRKDLNTWRISLYNVKNGTEDLFWDIDESNWIDTKIVPRRRVLRHPVLLPDSSIVFIGENTHVIYRVSKTGELIWKARGYRFHHAINPEEEGFLWCCSKESCFVKQFDKYGVSFESGGLAKLDVETGEVVWEKPISDIIIKNNKLSLLLGNGNGEGDKGKDPLHLNDVQIITKDSPWMKKGDLMISLRNRSTILHYRPKEDQLVNVITGDFLYQHDVDYLNDSLISIFNNNKSGIGPENFFRKNFDELESKYSLKTSNIHVYDLKNDCFYQPLDSILAEIGFFTHDQGLHEYLPGFGWILESQNQSDLVVVKGDSILHKGFLALDNDGRKVDMNWARFYTNLDFLNN